MSPDTLYILKILGYWFIPYSIVLFFLRKKNLDNLEGFNPHKKKYSQEEADSFLVDSIESLFTLKTKWHRLPWRLKIVSEYEREEQAKKERTKSLKVRTKRLLSIWISTLIVFILMGLTNIINNDTVFGIFSFAIIIILLFTINQIFHIVFSLLLPKTHVSWINKEYPYFWGTTLFTIIISFVGFMTVFGAFIYHPLSVIYEIFTGHGRMLHVFYMFGSMFISSGIAVGLSFILAIISPDVLKVNKVKKIYET